MATKKDAKSSKTAAASKSKTTTVRFSAPEGKKLTRKQRKIAKKVSKFDEMDLRNYPMTVGKWIGTFILLAIPLINVICCICWFFGVGNKSRSAWIRSYVVIFLIIVILLGVILGAGWFMLKKAASENAGAETAPEILYYGIEKFADLIGGDIAETIKAYAAAALGLSDGSNGNNNNGESGNNSNEYNYGGEEEDWGNWGYEE